jgi:hypothetical protein
MCEYRTEAVAPGGRYIKNIPVDVMHAQGEWNISPGSLTMQSWSEHLFCAAERHPRRARPCATYEQLPPLPDPCCC